MDGFTIMHERVSSDYFSLFNGPSAGEFPVQYIVSLSLLAMVGIVVQPHFIATGGGSAKSEDEARIGLVVGNFMKRLCTVGWALTALIALALLAGNAEIATDPDRVWGVAAREILGPLNMGLSWIDVGLSVGGDDELSRYLYDCNFCFGDKKCLCCLHQSRCG